MLEFGSQWGDFFFGKLSCTSAVLRCAEQTCLHNMKPSLRILEGPTTFNGSPAPWAAGKASKPRVRSPRRPLNRPAETPGPRLGHRAGLQSRNPREATIWLSLQGGRSAMAGKLQNGSLQLQKPFNQVWCILNTTLQNLEPLESTTRFDGKLR